MKKTLASWGPHWFPGVRVPVWEPQAGTIVGGLLSRDGTGDGAWICCWGAWFILWYEEGVDMGVESLLSLLRIRAVFWLKTVFFFFVSVFIWLVFVFTCLCLADHQGGWGFQLPPDSWADVSLDDKAHKPVSQSEHSGPKDALNSEKGLQSAHFPQFPPNFWLYCCCLVTQSCTTLRSHELQQYRSPCLPSSPRVQPSSCPLNRWCHPTISSSATLFSFCLQSFPASGSFPMSLLFASGGQSIRASASVLSMNIQGWFPGYLGLNLGQMRPL